MLWIVPTVFCVQALPVFAAEVAITHNDLETATWTPIGERAHADAGTVSIATATVRGVECYQSVATTEVPGEVLLGILSDPVSSMKWASAGITEAEVLLRAGNKVDYYQHLDVPGWTMVADRFWFSTGMIDHNAALLGWRYRKLEGGGPYRERYEAHKVKYPSAIEPTLSVGSWTFKPTDAGTLITYGLCTEIGGSIPVAVERYATRRTLPDTVGDLVREGRRRVAGK